MNTCQKILTTTECTCDNFDLESAVVRYILVATKQASVKGPNPGSGDRGEFGGHTPPPPHPNFFKIQALRNEFAVYIEGTLLMKLRFHNQSIVRSTM